MSEVLFVCAGNAARSQMGEAFYNQVRGDGAAESAGTEAIVGKPMPPYVLEVMNEVGIDVSKAQRKLISEEMAARAAKIILLTDKSLPEYLQADSKVEIWDITDPRYTDLDFHRQTRDAVKARVDQLLTRQANA